MTEQQPKQSRIKTVEVLQIAAGLTAALRWAIALMPLDGVRFTLSSREWFEPLSFVLSILFVVVEIGATAYIMRAWRKEVDRQTQSALLFLWVVALALMLVAQVPPLIANIDGVSVSTFHPLLKIVWVTCGVAVTFVVIGGVGYAEKSIEAKPAAQALSTDLQPAQVPSTGETDAPASVTGDDTGYNASQSRQNATSSDFGAKPDALGVEELSEAQNAVSVLDTIEARLAQVPLTGKYTVDMVNCLLAVPEAKSAQLAAYIGCSRQHVDNTLNKWEQAKKISKNGQVKFIEPVNN